MGSKLRMPSRNIQVYVHKILLDDFEWRVFKKKSSKANDGKRRTLSVYGIKQMFEGS